MIAQIYVQFMSGNVYDRNKYDHIVVLITKQYRHTLETFSFHYDDMNDCMNLRTVYGYNIVKQKMKITGNLSSYHKIVQTQD